MPRLYIVEQNALSVAGHYFGYTACVARAARLAGFKVVLLTNLHSSAQFTEESSTQVLPVFAHTWSEAEQQGLMGWQSGNFAYDLALAFHSFPPSAEDHVLIHTIGPVEL